MKPCLMSSILRHRVVVVVIWGTYCIKPCLVSSTLRHHVMLLVIGGTYCTQVGEILLPSSMVLHIGGTYCTKVSETLLDIFHTKSSGDGFAIEGTYCTQVCKTLLTFSILCHRVTVLTTANHFPPTSAWRRPKRLTSDWEVCVWGGGGACVRACVRNLAIGTPDSRLSGKSFSWLNINHFPAHSLTHCILKTKKQTKSNSNNKTKAKTTII